MDRIHNTRGHIPPSCLLPRWPRLHVITSGQRQNIPRPPCPRIRNTSSRAACTPSENLGHEQDHEQLPFRWGSRDRSRMGHLQGRYRGDRIPTQEQGQGGGEVSLIAKPVSESERHRSGGLRDIAIFARVKLILIYGIKLGSTTICMDARGRCIPYTNSRFAYRLRVHESQIPLVGTSKASRS